LALLKHNVDFRNGENYFSYGLTIEGQDIKTFYENIPVVGAKAEKIKRIVDGQEGRNHYPGYESIPNGWRAYLINRVYSYRTRHKIRIDKQYKYGTARQVVKKIADLEDNEYLKLLCSDDIIWERIINIQPLGTEPTYDIEVEETHNFLVMGFVVHNSRTMSKTRRLAGKSIPKVSLPAAASNRFLWGGTCQRIWAGQSAKN
jgi:intein/homing endonuclease